MSLIYISEITEEELVVCAFASQTNQRKSMVRHTQVGHTAGEDRHGDVNKRYRHLISICTIFKEPHVHLFKVPTTDAAVSGDPIEELITRHLQTFKQRWVQPVNTVPPTVHRVARSTWDDRTQWLAHFAGLDVAVIARAARLPRQTHAKEDYGPAEPGRERGPGRQQRDDDEPKLERLCELVDEVLNDCYVGAQTDQCNVQVHRVLTV